MGLCSSPNLPNNITLCTVNIAGLNPNYSHKQGWGGATEGGAGVGGECYLHVGINKIGERKDI